MQCDQLQAQSGRIGNVNVAITTVQVATHQTGKIALYIPILVCVDQEDSVHGSQWSRRP